MRPFHKIVSSLLSVTLLSAAFFAPYSAHALDENQKKEMGEFIREYLVQNPEVMIEVQEALEKKQAEDNLVKTTQAVKSNKPAIYKSKYDLSLGNSNGDVTVVEFFDYNCGYCRHALGDMESVLRSDKNVRFVLKEFPILGPESLAAHKVSDAFRKIAPGKYGSFHRALLGKGGRATEASALRVAESLGVSEKDIRAKMASSPNDASVREAYRLASSLGISGTPTYVIGNEAIPGAVGASALKKKIENVRACGKTSC